MAPDTRVQAYCSNVAPFAGSKLADLAAGQILDHRCVREHEPVAGGDIFVIDPGAPQGFCGAGRGPCAADRCCFHRGNLQKLRTGESR